MRIKLTSNTNKWVLFVICLVVICWSIFFIVNRNEDIRNVEMVGFANDIPVPELGVDYKGYADSIDNKRSLQFEDTETGDVFFVAEKENMEFRGNVFSINGNGKFLFTGNYDTESSVVRVGDTIPNDHYRITFGGYTRAINGNHILVNVEDKSFMFALTGTELMQDIYYLDMSGTMLEFAFESIDYVNSKAVVTVEVGGEQNDN